MGANILVFLPVREWPYMSVLARMLHLASVQVEICDCWGEAGTHWREAQRRYASLLIANGCAA